MKQTYLDLTQLAIESQKFSHSPYSHYKIGAAILLSNGKMYGGANIENASFGATVCAERTAIFKAYSENNIENKIIAVAVVSEATTPWPPCGLCRQVIAEFCDEKTEIITSSTKSNITNVMKFSDIFPNGFDPSFLK